MEKENEPKIEGVKENFKKPVEVPFLVQTYPCRQKITHKKSGLTFPLSGWKTDPKMF